MKNRLYKLVAALAAPTTEIVGQFELGNIVIDSISIDKKNKDVIFHIFDNDEFDIEIYYEQIEDENILQLIKDLEQLLIN